MQRLGLFMASTILAVALAACGSASSNPAPSGSTDNGNAAATASKASLGAATGGDANRGKTLFNNGANGAPACSTCHYVDKNKGVLVGPNQYDVGKRAESRFKEASYKGTAKSAAEFLKESIVNPNVYVAEGFQPNVMYQNYRKDLTDAQINDLVAYLLTLKG